VEFKKRSRCYNLIRVTGRQARDFEKAPIGESRRGEVGDGGSELRGEYMYKKASRRRNCKLI
jgi:hypothetical protein